MSPLMITPLLSALCLCTAYNTLDATLSDALLQELVDRLDLEEMGLTNEQPLSRRDVILGREPSLRDREYLQHSSLFAHQSMQGGAGEGFQRLRPDGSMKNVQVVKTDVLPAYCNPANPCPLGYTAEDGCLEDFENTAAFSRDYQAAQDCMCDSEHMFDCPGESREGEIDALARSIDQGGEAAEPSLDRILQQIDIQNNHKVVAKKFFSKKSKRSDNPYLKGEKLPIVAKKAPQMAM